MPPKSRTGNGLKLSYSIAITEVYSSFFADRNRFPAGSIEFDHALVMRDVRHEWHKADDIYSVPRTARI